MKMKKYPDYSRREPKLKNCKRMQVRCDYCGKLFWEKKSAYKKRKRHFCSRKCYSLFRKEKLPFYEQPAYKGVREEGISKQIYYRRYCENHKERIAHLKARRYARERGAIGSHTLEEWEDLKKKYNYTCPMCGRREPEIKLTKDHIIPLSEGGTDYIWNIQPLCRSCNSKKGKKIFTKIQNY